MGWVNSSRVLSVLVGSLTEDGDVIGRNSLRKVGGRRMAKTCCGGYRDFQKPGLERPSRRLQTLKGWQSPRYWRSDDTPQTNRGSNRSKTNRRTNPGQKKGKMDRTHRAKCVLDQNTRMKRGTLAGFHPVHRRRSPGSSSNSIASQT